jgi:hypothetical protein
VDIIAWFPFDYVIVEAIWPPCFVNNNARYVSLLKLLRLVRMISIALPAIYQSVWACRKDLGR